MSAATPASIRRTTEALREEVPWSSSLSVDGHLLNTYICGWRVDASCSGCFGGTPGDIRARLLSLRTPRSVVEFLKPVLPRVMGVVRGCAAGASRRSRGLIPRLRENDAQRFRGYPARTPRFCRELAPMGSKKKAVACSTLTESWQRDRSPRPGTSAPEEPPHRLDWTSHIGARYGRSVTEGISTDRQEAKDTLGGEVTRPVPSTPMHAAQLHGGVETQRPGSRRLRDHRSAATARSALFAAGVVGVELIS